MNRPMPVRPGDAGTVRRYFYYLVVRVKSTKSKSGR
jgi:hypothetical protein